MPKRVAAACVGRLSEPFLRDACAEYVKRLSRYCQVSVLEVADQPDELGAPRALKLEGEALLKQIRPDDLVITLEIAGDMLTSEALAEKLDAWFGSEKRVVFVIGGSNGLSAEVLSRASHRVSLSRMTLTHGFARVLLLEQIYRACKINAGEKYHK